MSFKRLLYGLLLASLSIQSSVGALKGRRERARRTYTALEDSWLPSLVDDSLFYDFDTSNTPSHARVRNFLTSTFTDLAWHVEEDAFSGPTPFGTKKFTNLIFTKHPSAPSRLILAAHYDSKYFPDDVFVGATDSAAPVAFLLNLARFVDPFLPVETPETTLQIVLFDGEEAFETWTDTDSIYGARHLAEKWAADFSRPHLATVGEPRGRQIPSELDRVQALVLLDLLGAPNPKVANYFAETSWQFKHLQAAEARLKKSDTFSSLATLNISSTYGPAMIDAQISFFQPHAFTTVSDDHLPFLHRGVPILHLIPVPFPKGWHTPADDASALDHETMARWALLLRLFTLEYFAIQPTSSSSAASKRSHDTADLVRSSGFHPTSETRH